MTPALRIVLGALLLVFGRSLYWIIIGLAGFLAGLGVSKRGRS